MKLLKVNLIFIPLLALCLGAIGYAARKMLLEDARQHVLQNARLLMETALSSRKYTIKYITPLILQYDYNAQTGLSEFRKSIEEIPTEPSPEAANNLFGSLKKGYLLGQQRALDEEKRFLESLERRAEELRPTGFHPQAVSFFAALEILADLHSSPSPVLFHPGGSFRLFGCAASGQSPALCLHEHRLQRRRCYARAAWLVGRQLFQYPGGSIAGTAPTVRASRHFLWDALRGTGRHRLAGDCRRGERWRRSHSGVDLAISFH